ncbi:transporter substrate-binding domain-containing protein [Colwellia sp. 1_MG-2023]|uniref:response regulator n=1 Tax=Colwellia sp. 1_MG-2023 TaxID=3062649 RepID=UPI0026E2C748|nr:transporter substrate-binding domain-containing protein [Colwellia sp. 1_MG-2023]MDO6445632.1 transporter substrate-binding domain-containing protein [Colwellia sp. 1_MG-2023]
MKLRILFHCFFIATLLCSPCSLAEENTSKEKTPIHIVALEKNYPFSFMLPNGSPSGLYIEFWQLWAKTNNTPIKISLRSLEDGLQLIKLKNTMHAGLFKNTEREQWADFTLPIHNVQSRVIYKRNFDKSTKLSELDGIKISTKRLSYQETYVKNNFPNVNVVNHEDFNQAITRLLEDSNNEIQGVIAELPHAMAELAKRGISGVFVISDEVILSNNVFGLIAKEQPELLAKINEGIENIPVEEVVALERHWLPALKPFFDTFPHMPLLTEEENNWLLKNNAFSLGVDPQWAPFEFYDENKEFSGISADYIKHAESKLNVTFMPQKELSWAQAFAGFKQGNVDVMSAIFFTEERAKNINFTEPYFEISLVLVSKENAYYAESLSSLDNKKLGLITDYVYDELIQQKHPNIELISVNTVEEGLKLLQSGKIDAFMDSIATINYEINKHKLNDIIITAFTPYKLELTMAVRKGLEPLVPILNKTFLSMTEKQRAAIANNWLSIHVQSGANITTILFWSLPILAFLILIIFIFYRMNLRLKKEVSIRQENEQQLIATQRDLAAQKKAMDVHSLVSVSDIKGNIVYANDKFCAISGYSHQELIGRNHSILKSDQHPSAFWREMYLIVLKGGHWNGEICNRTKSGERFWVDTTIVPFYNNENKLGGYISVLTDITRQKSAIARLADAKKQAEVANESKNEFLANMSHEIRTPMNGVIGMTNLLLDTQLTQEQINFASTVKYSAESLLIIINDILDFSKIEAGMLDLEPLEFDLSILLHEIGSSIAFQAHEKGLDLICPGNSMSNQSYIADPGRIRQILNNLISNAIKFTDKGEVSVFCRVVEQSKQRTKLCFEIKDTGIGISKEKQKNLFERFSQADNSTTRKFGGTGLGLTISKQLVEMMGGEIGVKSTEGQGSTFWFTLNVENAHCALSKESLDNLQDQKILIVDDNLTNRTLLTQLLNKWQAKSTAVDSGKNALITLNEAADQGSPFQIAILDMQMPEMDGVQLGKVIKSKKNLADTRLVMLTSQGLRGDSDLLKAVGFNGYLNKPIDESILYKTLKKVSGVNASDKKLTNHLTAHQIPQFKARVLVVEDNAINQRVAQGLLQKFGIQVDVAANGKEALSSLKDLPFDLVLMDCQMPIMDGYEATKNIRAEHSEVLNRKIPIIAMTANSMKGDQAKCISVGMDDFISKPVNPNKLEEVLTRWLK